MGFMIKKIDIKGFKSFDSVSLELNNFTLLAGRNSMGKTYYKSFHIYT